MEPFGAQQVTLPDSEVEMVEHGFGNTVLKTAGLSKPGTLKIDRIISADTLTGVNGAAFFEWQKLAQDPFTQTGGDPLDYKMTVIVEELGNLGVGGNPPVVLNTWTFEGCWPTRINGREFDRTASENLMESIELSVDYILDF